MHFMYHTLYLLYLKVKLKYNNLRSLNTIPNLLIFIILD